MVYLKKIISQDLERTASFSLEAVHDFFEIPRGETSAKTLRLVQCGIDFRVRFQHRETRNEYHVFLEDVLFQFQPSIGDILIFTKINNDLFECEHIRQSNPQYQILLAHFAQGRNHQLVNNL